MLIQDKKHMTWGTILTIIFIIILGFMFSKNFRGRDATKINAFKASYNLYTSIAKGSSNYFPQLKESNREFAGHEIQLTLKNLDKAVAERGQILLQKAGAGVSADGGAISVRGDLSKILHQALLDSEALFNNQEQGIEDRYSMQGREAAYVWWRTLTSMQKSLMQDKDFAAGKFVDRVIKRGVEVGYNFYGIPAEKATSKAGILTFSLVFYVLYTLLWGFSIFYLFEGIGLRMSSGAKKEV